MQNISKIKNIVTIILLCNILFSIAIFIALYNSTIALNTDNNQQSLIYQYFAVFLINIIISGILMIYIYNNLNKWVVEYQLLNNSYAESKSVIQQLENEKTKNIKNESNLSISHQEFLVKFEHFKNLNEVAKNIFTEISNNIQITSAVFFIFDKSTDSFIPISTYALLNEEISSFKTGEGLNGQVAKNKKELILTSIDEKYFNIVSGLGFSQPSCLAIFPVIIENSVEGIVEISSFVNFTEIEINFLNNIFSGLSKFKNIEIVEVEK